MPTQNRDRASATTRKKQSGPFQIKAKQGIHRQSSLGTTLIMAGIRGAEFWQTKDRICLAIPSLLIFDRARVLRSGWENLFGFDMVLSGEWEYPLLSKTGKVKLSKWQLATTCHAGWRIDAVNLLPRGVPRA